MNAPDPLLDYPLGERRPELVTTPAGTPLAEVTLEGLRSGRIAPAELRATPETLQRQAAVARSAGREQLAENLERAATAAELEAMAQQLAAVAAPRCAAFVREAADVMAERGLLRTSA